MDIIAAHRQGLIEQLDEEVAALAGHGRDHAQRAIVLHHLYDHSRGHHGWALIEARRALRSAAALDLLQRKLNRWGWFRSGRAQAQAALDVLCEAVGEVGRRRTAAAYRAYRLSATRALRDEAEADLDPSLLDLLAQCHAARRTGVPMPSDAELALAEESERLAANTGGCRALESAWLTIEATGLRRPARRLVGDKVLAKLAHRDRRRGCARVEWELRNDPALPPSFRANPAQHFYALQRILQERRRKQWREACDQLPDAVELAA